MAVELAVALPAVVAVLGVMLGAVGVAQRQVVATDAASTAARVAVTGTDEAAAAAAARMAGSGAQVTVARAHGWITVTVIVERPPWPAARAVAHTRAAGSS